MGDVSIYRNGSASAPKITGGPIGRSRSILLVEDDSPVREGLAIVLRRAGWDVVVAEDGRAGAEAFQKRRADVVLTDLMMPRLDGLGVLAEVRAVDAEVPVVVLTGYATVDRCRDALRAGANDFVSKPCEAASLKRILDRAYQKRAEAETLREVRAATQQTLYLKVPADIGKRPGVVAQVVAAADAAGFGDRRWTIRLAVDEAFVNAVVHGARCDPAKEISVAADFDGGRATIAVADSGEGFDPATVPDALSDAQGGRGLFLLRSFCDEVTWRSSGAGTTCVMSFHRNVADTSWRSPDA